MKIINAYKGAKREKRSQGRISHLEVTVEKKCCKRVKDLKEQHDIQLKVQIWCAQAKRKIFIVCALLPSHHGSGIERMEN